MTTTTTIVCLKVTPQMLVKLKKNNTITNTSEVGSYMNCGSQECSFPLLVNNVLNNYCAIPVVHTSSFYQILFRNHHTEIPQKKVHVQQINGNNHVHPSM